MTIDEQRAAFEKWRRSTHTIVSYEFDREDNGDYVYALTQSGWEAWQAAIEDAKKTVSTE